MKRILLFIFSIILWMIWWIIAIIVIPSSLFITLFIPKKSYDPLGQILCKILMYSALIFPRVTGIDPKSLPFPVIFVSNHVSIFDLFISGAVFPGYPRGLELKQFFSLPVYGWLISRFGNIPIEPENYSSVRKSINTLLKILTKKERNIVIMPEGKRTTTGKVDKFGSAAFLLSIKTGIPVVPVVFKGLFKINNKNSIIIKPGKFTIIFLKPVYPEKFNNENEMAEYIRNLIIKKLA